MKKRIFLIDDDETFVNDVADFFKNDPDYEIVGTAENGEIALTQMDTAKPDVIILDLIMPILDGYGFLQRLNKGDVKVIVASALKTEAFIAKAVDLGADFFVCKPLKPELLRQRIDECLGAELKPSPAVNLKKQNKQIEEKITNIFITVGIPAHIKGYQFLREAIKMAIENPDIINSITRKLYPEVAQRFDTSPSKVERAIRHAIEVAWNRGKIENINSLFGVRVYNHNEKPTNGEFIALVADKMLLECI